MALGDMWLLDEPYVPSTIDKTMIEIGSRNDLDNLGCGEQFWRVSIGEGFRPKIKGPYFFHSIDIRVSPKHPNDGPQEYLIAIQYDKLSSGKEVKTYHWLATKHLFSRDYHGIFTNRSKIDKFMEHVNKIYDNDPKWKRWINNYMVSLDNRSRFYRSAKQLRDL